MAFCTRLRRFLAEFGFYASPISGVWTDHQSGLGRVAIHTNIAVRMTGLALFQSFSGFLSVLRSPDMGRQSASWMAVVALGQGECLVKRSSSPGFYLGPAFPVGGYLQTVALGAIVAITAKLFSVTAEAFVDLGSCCLEWVNYSKT